jgi:hypothetical protein
MYHVMYVRTGSSATGGGSWRRADGVARYFSVSLVGEGSCADGDTRPSVDVDRAYAYVGGAAMRVGRSRASQQ